MSDYKYTITWKPRKIAAKEKRDDVFYRNRKFTYRYSHWKCTLNVEAAKITLSFDAGSRLKQKSLLNIINDMLEKLYIIYTIIYARGLVIESASMKLEKYSPAEKCWLAIETEEPLPQKEELTGYFMIDNTFPECCKPFDQETWGSDEFIS